MARARTTWPNIDVDIPRDALTVVTGPSGSGKSSLALDTIYTEGRRRFVESLSTYARQFLGSRDKPPVERIDGLGPSVAVEATTSRGHPRSTVATTTEIHDHLRVLFSRAGTQRCPEHKKPLEHTDAGGVARRIVKQLSGSKGWIVAPIFGPGVENPDKPTAALKERLEAWRAAGFLRVLIGGAEERLDQKLPRLSRGVVLDLVIDRVAFDKGSRTRIAEAVEQAAAVAHGRVSAIVAGAMAGAKGARSPASEPKRVEFSTQGACPVCGFRLAHNLDPRHFSFNTHAGACEQCDGLGSRVQCEPDLLISRQELPLADGAIAGKFGRYLTKGKGYYEYLLRTVAKLHKIDLSKPFQSLTQKQRDLIARGAGARAEYKVKIAKQSARAEIEERFTAEWPGLCGHIDAWHAKAEDPEWAALLETVMRRATCSACEGERLRPEARAVTMGHSAPATSAGADRQRCAWTGCAVEKDCRAPSRTPPGRCWRELTQSPRFARARRVGLPEPGPPDGDLVRRRGAPRALVGQPRLATRRSVLRARRAHRRPAPGGRRATGRRPARAEVRREHGPGGRARREPDASAPIGSSTWAREPDGWGAHVVASGTPAEIEAHPSSLTGAALRGEIAMGGERDTKREPGHGLGQAARSQPAQPGRRRFRAALRRAVRRVRTFGFGQEHAGPRLPGSGPARRITRGPLAPSAITARR